MNTKILFAFLIAALFLIGCDDDPASPEVKTCSVEKEASLTSINEDVDLKYELYLTGDAKVSTLRYLSPTGFVTVENINSDWEIEFTGTSQDSVYISATGTTINGSIKVEYKAKNTNTELKGQDICSQSSN